MTHEDWADKFIDSITPPVATPKILKLELVGHIKRVADAAKGGKCRDCDYSVGNAICLHEDTQQVINDNGGAQAMQILPNFSCPHFEPKEGDDGDKT